MSDHEIGKGGSLFTLPGESNGNGGSSPHATAKDIPYDETSDPFKNSTFAKKTSKQFRIVKTWTYTDENGAELFEVCRLENGETGADGKRNKTYKQRHKDPVAPGQYINHVKGVRQVPYQLPGLIRTVEQGQIIFIVEGEKCSDAVIALGGAATCNAMGAQKWGDGLTPFFKGADVVILPDNDEPGAKHASLVTSKLQGTAQRVRILQLPNLPPKGDIADWIAGGGTLEQLHALVASDAPKDTTSDHAKPNQPAGFRMASKGLVWVDPSDKERPEIVVSGPFEVIAESQDDAGYSWGVLLRWKDPAGRSKDWAMPRSLLAGDGLDVRRVLLDGGLYIGASGKARGLLTTYLASVHVKTRAKAVASTGWFGAAFVLPDSTIGLAKDEAVILQTPHFVDHAYNVRGSLEDWKANIARLAIGNSRLVLALSTSFAATLVGPCGAESAGIHFRGRSSIGKTTALSVAGSVWGGGDRGFIRSWRATSNGGRRFSYP